MSKKHNKVCRVLNYMYNLLIVLFTTTRSVSVSALASLIGIPIGITSSASGIKICVITAGIKRFK